MREIWVYDAENREYYTLDQDNPSFKDSLKEAGIEIGENVLIGEGV